MSIGTILIILLIVLLVTSLPTWQYSRNWGYVPSGALSVVLVIVAVLLITGNI